MIKLKVSVSKTIQERPYEPYNITLETESSVQVQSAVPTEMRNLHLELNKTLDTLFTDRRKHNAKSNQAD